MKIVWCNQIDGRRFFLKKPHEILDWFYIEIQKFRCWNQRDDGMTSDMRRSVHGRHVDAFVQLARWNERNKVKKKKGKKKNQNKKKKSLERPWKKVERPRKPKRTNGHPWQNVVNAAETTNELKKRKKRKRYTGANELGQRAQRRPFSS